MHAKIRLQLAIAAAYLAVGWLSLQVVSAGSYVAPVYPPAGIALAAIILYGVRLWPAVFIGAVATNALAMLHSGGEPGLTALASGIGATVQALFGAWLAHRLIHFPTPLDSPGTIGRLLFVVAPTSSLINASLSVPLLAAAGTLTPDELPFAWAAWWLGDTLGALLALPLMFVFLARPAEAWRSRRATVTVPLVIIALLTAAVFERLQRAESLRIQTQFERESEHVATLVDKRLLAQLDSLVALAGFAALNERLDRESFRAFVTPILLRHPGTQNFSWNPWISSAERATFEARVRHDDLAGYAILDRDDASPGRVRLAHERDHYFPILFVEPRHDNAGVLGLDPLSIPNTAVAIEHTRESGEAIASEGFLLTQERGQQRGVVLYQAVRAPDAAMVKGLVSSAFRMDDALHSITAGLPERHLWLCLVDTAASAGNARLSGPSGCEDHALDVPLARHFALPFAGRPWELRLFATDAYADNLRTLAAWWSIITGVLAAGLLAAFLLMTSGHARRVERLVDLRTRELAAATDDLRAQRAALSRAQHIARLGSWELDTGNGELRCSDGLRRLLQLPQRSPLGYADLLDAISPEDRPRFDRAVSAMRNGGEPITLDCHPLDSPAVTLQFVIDSENLGSPDERVVGTAQDVSLARKAEADIQQLAHFDTLTGLPNRMLWSIRAKAALQGARRHGDTLAVLFMDLDHFKTINDSLGHNAGDALLQAVARRLALCIREEDFLARLGGDEFVALLPRLNDPSDAATVAHKMLSVTTEAVEIEGHVLQPSISIGIALFPTDGDDIDTLLKHADTAMYGAKSAGRNTFRHFVEAMNVQAIERLTIENGLRRAIDRDQLVLHWQAQIDAVLDRVVGVEALVRWNRVETGELVMPDRFVPIAEEAGIIFALGDWVLRQACRQQRAWQGTSNGELLVAVNISALQFNRPDFVARVQAILQDTGADPRRIELEITESALMGSSEDLAARLGRLRALGLTLALDDFGTGYSSLGRLNRLPISRLKLDRSFVQHLPRDADSAAIASATLSMARALKLEVVAEGVETESQKAYLFARGCRLMQGYLISRPLPLDEFHRFLAAEGGHPATTT